MSWNTVATFARGVVPNETRQIWGGGAKVKLQIIFLIKTIILSGYFISIRRFYFLCLDGAKVALKPKEIGSVDDMHVIHFPRINSH